MADDHRRRRFRVGWHTRHPCRARRRYRREPRRRQLRCSAPGRSMRWLLGLLTVGSPRTDAVAWVVPNTLRLPACDVRAPDVCVRVQWPHRCQRYGGLQCAQVRLTSVLPLVIVVTGCGGKNPTAPTAPTATRMTIIGADAVLTGVSTSYTVTATMADGTSRTVTPTWSSSKPEVAAVDGAGQLEGRAMGPYPHGIVRGPGHIQEVQIE